MSKKKSHWRESLNLVISLLIVWFVASLGCSILWRDWLDEHAFKVGNAPFGFWMAQQGSIIVFILLLFVYAIGMNKLDKKYHN